MCVFVHVGALSIVLKRHTIRYTKSLVVAEEQVRNESETMLGSTDEVVHCGFQNGL